MVTFHEVTRGTESFYLVALLSSVVLDCPTASFNSAGRQRIQKNAHGKAFRGQDRK